MFSPWFCLLVCLSKNMWTKFYSIFGNGSHLDKKQPFLYNFHCF